MSFNKQEARATMVMAMTMAGWPEDKATTCADLAVHAAEEANARLDAVTATSDDPLVSTQAMVLAANLLAQHYTLASASLREAGVFTQQETMQ